MHLFDASNELARRLRHRRRPHPARGRRRLRVEVPRRRARHALLLRRRRGRRRAASTRASRWRRCGSCRSSSSARTTSTRWARRSTARSSVRGRVAEGARLRHGARSLRRRRRARGASDRIGEAVERARATTATPTLVEVVHLPLPRPLDDATRASTARRTRSRSGRSATRCRWRASGCSRTTASKRTRSSRSRPTVEAEVAGRGAVRRARAPEADPETVWDFVYADPDTDPRKI